MRRLAFALILLAAPAFAQQPPDRIFAVFFDDFSAELDATAQQIVASAAAEAINHPAVPVKVTGYANAAGSAQADIDLSQARADAVASLLQQDGVVAGQITRAAAGTPPNSEPGVERRRVDIFLDMP